MEISWYITYAARPTFTSTHTATMARQAVLLFVLALMIVCASAKPTDFEDPSLAHPYTSALGEKVGAGARCT